MTGGKIAELEVIAGPRRLGALDRAVLNDRGAPQLPEDTLQPFGGSARTLPSNEV